MQPGPDGTLRAVGTGETEVLDCGLVLRAVGYHGREVADLPYDARTGTVPSDRGRVEPGTYVAGWVKRGPTGFIGTNKSCAQETVARGVLCVGAGVSGPVGPGGLDAVYRRTQKRSQLPAAVGGAPVPSSS